MEVNTSPPRNIRTVITTSWESENASISTVDMLDTVMEETEVKNRSTFRGLNEPVLGFRALSNPKPSRERERK
ncbi:hypothetical protein GQ457_15G024460 [Hibiscus cannabinus]